MQRTVYIFVDESGDLGFSSSSSRHVIAVALATVRPLEIRRMVRKAQSRFGPAERRLGELKFNSASPRLRTYVLEGIAHADTRIAWNALFKPHLQERRGIDKEAILNSLCRSAIGETMAGVRARNFSIIVDKRRIRENIRERFDNEVKATVLARQVGFVPPNISISHFDSLTSEGLQAADFVAGAVFRSLERGDDSCLEIIRSKVVFNEIL